MMMMMIIEHIYKCVFVVSSRKCKTLINAETLKYTKFRNFINVMFLSIIFLEGWISLKLCNILLHGVVSVYRFGSYTLGALLWRQVKENELWRIRRNDELEAIIKGENIVRFIKC